MSKMTKADIEKRQLEIMTMLDEMDEKTNVREAKIRTLTSEEQKEEREKLLAEQREQDRQYDNLVRESAGLSTRMKDMATREEAKIIKTREDEGKELREMIEKCFIEKRAANATTILANAITSGGDQNVNANLEAGGLIPVEIKPIIDTKVPGVELPDDLQLLTGVTGTQVIPYSINDVKFTIEGEVTKVAEQSLDFANIKTSPVRVAASVPVSRRSVAQAAFDIIAFLTYKFQKGWAIFRAQHIYGHGVFDEIDMPFAKAEVVELTLDENIGKNLALKAAAIEDAIPDGATTFIMDKVTETNLAFTKLLAGQGGDKTVIEGGKIAQTYAYIVSPFINYTINASGEASKENDRYIGIGKFSYEAMQQHGEFRFNIDAASEAAFNAGTVFVGVSTDFSLTELSAKVNGTGAVQAFKLIKLVEEPTTH